MDRPRAIRREIEAQLGYELSRTLGDIRPSYEFDVTCQGSVPEAITAFLESDSVESAVRLAISLGSDADTQAAIAGGIAEAFHGGVPDAIGVEVLARLPHEFRDVIASSGAGLAPASRSSADLSCGDTQVAFDPGVTPRLP